MYQLQQSYSKNNIKRKSHQRQRCRPGSTGTSNRQVGDNNHKRTEEETLMFKQYTFRDGILRWNRKIYLPAGTLRTEILDRYHNVPIAAHQGSKKVLEVIKRHYYWPQIRQDVAAVTQSCIYCQRNNPANVKPPGFLHLLPVPSERFQEIAMDWTKLSSREDGNNTALIIVDRLTKMVVIIGTKATDTAERAAAMI
jgi:hypothetical protein